MNFVLNKIDFEYNIQENNVISMPILILIFSRHSVGFSFVRQASR